MNRPLAFSYCRLSTEAQLRGDGMRRQMDEAREYAEAHGLDLAAEAQLFDLGISAYRGDNLAAGNLGRFVTAVEAKKVPPGSYLLVESLDRLSRQEVTSSMFLLMRLVSAGIKIATLDDGFVYSQEADVGRLVHSLIVMSRAHEESRTKSNRARRTWEQKRRQAGNVKLTARCPGWLSLRPDGSGFDVRTDRVKIVQAIFENAISGMGSYAISRRLNEAGTSPFGRSNGWQTSYISKILSNRAVLGEFQPHRLIDGRRVPDGDPISGYFPAIITEDEFFRAARGRIARQSGASGRKGAYVSNLFSGIARCAYCRGPMHFLNKGKPPKGGAYLVCDNGRRRVRCRASAWRYSHFEASFLAFVAEMDLASVAENAGAGNGLQASIEAAAGRARSLEEQRDRVFALVLKGGPNATYLEKKLDAIGGELEAANAEWQTLNQEASEKLAVQSRLDESRETIRPLVESLQDRSSPDLYRLRSLLRDRIFGLVDQIALGPMGTVRLPLATEKFGRGERGIQLGVDKAVFKAFVKRPRQERNSWPFFSVLFKNGATRMVYVDAADPYQSQHQALMGMPEVIPS